MFAPANVAHFELNIPTVRNDFKVLAFDGTEAISTLYAIHVELVSERPDFDLESLLCQPAFLQFGLNGEGIHGHIEEVSMGAVGKRLTRYHLTLVPVLHYLQFSHQQRIFQSLTVPQIIAQVLKGHGILADVFTFHVTPGPERVYCTQYAESDYEFVQRLCAEEGIAWHHQHSPDDHRLVFTDHQSFFPRLDGATPYHAACGMVAECSVIDRFSMRFSTRTRTTTRRDYDFTHPIPPHQSRVTTEHGPELEDYRYPVFIDNEKHGKQLARQALERHRSDYQLAEGSSDQANLRSGHFFELTEHPRQPYNALWLLLSVHHVGKQPQVLEEALISDVKSEDGFTQGYRNSFSAIPWDVFYRPPLVTRQTLVSQTARVTGPVGEEIFCDEYGRVKVEFHWDRAKLGSDKSSCWLRVSSHWAGDRFGSVTIPRIGMEVVVTFLEGNPDNPLITGCVPNEITSVPYPLPEHKTKTVLRSRSSPANDGYNELSIEDHAGQELIYLRAQRDLEQLILNDSATMIGNDRHEQIARDSHSLIGNDRFEQVENNSSHLIKGDELHTTQGLRHTLIGGSEQISITGNSSTTVSGTLVIQAGPQVHVTAAHVVIDAGMSLTLKAGGHHLVINPGGIFSSVPIVEGGAPLAGVAPTQALSVEGAASAALQAPLLAPTQRSALMAKKPLCAVCEVVNQSGAAHA